MDRDALATLSKVLFVVWGYPEPTQTFIQRELDEMRRLGVEVAILAARRVRSSTLDQQLADPRQTTIMLGSALQIALKALRWCLCNPRAFLGHLLWAVRLPHRTHVHRLRMLGMLMAAASVTTAVRRSGCTYLHAHFISYHSEWTMCLSRLLGIPFGITVHATGLWKDHNIIAEKVAQASLVLSCTQFNVDYLRKLFPEHAAKVQLSRHGLELQSLGAARPLAVGLPVQWLAVGRLVPKKGFDYLIEAVARVRDRGAIHRLIIVGDGKLMKQLRRKIIRLGLERQVELRGSVPNADVWHALKRAYGLVAPSVRARNGDMDGTPNVILEAMAMARPVIASRLSGIPEAVRDGYSGVLVPPGDVEALADAMFVLASDRVRAARMGQHGRHLVERMFDVRANTVRQLHYLLSVQQAHDS